MKRRSFIRTAGSLAGGMALSAESLSAAAKEMQGAPTSFEGPMPTRQLGNTGEKISLIGFPGNGLRLHSEKDSIELIHKSIDRGVNFYDVSPRYGKDGECEIKMGIGLEGKRDQVFLASKTVMRDAARARQQLETSLTRLKTDHLDLYQMHFLQTLKEVEEAFAPGGVMELMSQAKEEGKIRYIGFSAHTTLSALEAMNRFRFDTVMFPVSFVEHFTFGFAQAVIELAHSQGVSVIGIKSTSGGSWSDSVPKEDRKGHWFRMIEEEPAIGMALRFALSQKAVITTVPASSPLSLDRAIPVACNYVPVSKEELEALHQIAKSSNPLFLEWQNRALMGHSENTDDFDENIMC
jgi:predicted aldo/keto reductase-like oxidoreductase